MAVVGPTDYATDGKIGVNLTTTYASSKYIATSGANYGQLPYTPGQQVHTNNGGRFLFVRAPAAITQYDCVVIGPGTTSASGTPTLNAVSISTGNIAPSGATTGYGAIGFAQVAFSAHDYGWVNTNGMPTVRCASGTNPLLPLFTTTTGGVLSNTTVSVALIQGLVAITSTSGISGVICIADYPHLMQSNPV